MTDINILRNPESIIEEFDYFIIDLWGVIHDGLHLYDGVLNTLEILKRKNKKVIFLSNAPRRAEKAEEVLERLGITKDLYINIITSGEAVYNYCRARYDLGAKYYYIGPERDAGLIKDLHYEEADFPAGADFCIVTGFNDENSTIEEKLPEIEKCIAEKLPMICANPDKIVVRKTGEKMLCAGVVADIYEEKGGKVEYFGKPYPKVYEMCFESFGKPPKNKIVAIGDGLHTDIGGANDFGIFSVLCTGGILVSRLGIYPGQMPDLKKLESLFKEENTFPKAVISGFGI